MSHGSGSQIRAGLSEFDPILGLHEQIVLFLRERAETACSDGQKNCPPQWASSETARSSRSKPARYSGSKTAGSSGNKELYKGTLLKEESGAHADTPHMNGSASSFLRSSAWSSEQKPSSMFYPAIPDLEAG